MEDSYSVAVAVAVAVAVWLFLILSYFLPLVVARVKEHSQISAIGVLNLFLGWTVIGWVTALVWANINEEKKINS